MMKDTITPRQLTAVAFVAVLSPLIRRFPRVLAMFIGRTAWLSGVFSLFIYAAAIALLHLIYIKKAPPYGLGDVFSEAVGTKGAKVLILLYSLWMVAYSGFTLRAFSERFVSTVYPGSPTSLFTVVLAVTCFAGAMGSFKALARSAMVFRLVMVGAFVMILALSLPSLDLSMLLPLTKSDIVPNIAGGAWIANVLGVTVFLAFAGNRLERGYRVRDYSLWFFIIFGAIEIMCVGCLGMLGPEMTANTSYPFFMLARDITILGSVERIEPLVIGLWVLSDFVMVSALWLLASENITDVFSLSCKKLIPTALIAASAVAAAIFTGRSAAEFMYFSEKVIPMANAVMVLSLVPIGITAAVRRRKRSKAE